MGRWEERLVEGPAQLPLSYFQVAREFQRAFSHTTPSPPPPLFHAQVGVTLGEVCEGLSAAASERVTHAGAVAGDVRRLVRGLTEVLQGLSEAVSK